MEKEEPLSKIDLLDKSSTTFKYECVVNKAIISEIFINWLQLKYQKLFELNPNLIELNEEQLKEINIKVAESVKWKIENNEIERLYNLTVENRSVTYNEKDNFVEIIYPDSVE